MVVGDSGFGDSGVSWTGDNEVSWTGDGGDSMMGGDGDSATTGEDVVVAFGGGDVSFGGGDGVFGGGDGAFGGGDGGRSDLDEDVGLGRSWLSSSRFGKTSTIGFSSPLRKRTIRRAFVIRVRNKWINHGDGMDFVFLFF